MRLFFHELKAQQLLFWRSREAAFFTFLLPIIFLVLLGSVYGDEQIDGINGSTYLLAGLIGYGVVATAFAGLAITLVLRRESGVLKRVRGTPLPPTRLPERGDRLDPRRDRARSGHAAPHRHVRPRRVLARRPGRIRARAGDRRCSLRRARAGPDRRSSGAPTAPQRW